MDRTMDDNGFQNLERIGWDASWEKAFDAINAVCGVPGRVSEEERGLYRILTATGEHWAEVSGSFRHNRTDRSGFPGVGDWVVASIAERFIIHTVVPRRTAFVRKVAGAVTEAQVVAANVDTVFVVQAMNRDFNLRRLERYLALAWESGANPVIVLNKMDLSSDSDTILERALTVAMGVPVHGVSAERGIGIEELETYLSSNRTGVFLGASGVGKSTLVNAICGKIVQQTASTRSGDDRGRHTTTHRQLIVTPRGGLLIDTPGMRELTIWDAANGIDEAFRDIGELAENCQFRDCSHGRETGCAVHAALSDGLLEADRFASYQKLQRELAYVARKQDQRAQVDERRRRKKAVEDGRRNRRLKQS